MKRVVVEALLELMRRDRLHNPSYPMGRVVSTQKVLQGLRLNGLLEGAEYLEIMGSGQSLDRLQHTLIRPAEKEQAG